MGFFLLNIIQCATPYSKGADLTKMAPFKTKSRQQNDTIVILQKAFKKARILVLVYGIDILILNHTV